MRFKMLSGDVNWKDYGAKFVSKRLNNGEFDYWLVLEFINMHDATGDEFQDKYYAVLQSISPESAGKEKTDYAIGSMYPEESERENDPLFQVLCLSDYGIYAVLWQGSGNNAAKLIREAHKQADLSTMLFGFYMDRPGNRLGQSGWDLIRGQDVREFLGVS